MHPNKDQLVAFGQGKLAPNESVVVEHHLEVCDRCCETLLDLQDDTFSELVRIARTAGSSRDSQPGATVHLSDGQPRLGGELPAELREHPRYQIVELVGRGGMGDVYRAKHRLMNRQVAIKLINSQLVQNPQAVERFRREVRAAARLAHPNIVAAYDAEQAGNAHFLVMEFVDGTDLASLVSQHGPLSPTEACRCICQVAEALHHAHSKGMVHRDIKPHNLMLSSTGQVRVLDFGLASFVTEAAGDLVAVREEGEGARGAHLTTMGSVMGTPDYIAPEQAQDAHTADIRADIYSLGCTCWFLLTGHPPFEADGILAKLQAHAEQAPPLLSAACPAAPLELTKIVARMMAKNPADRYQTPAEVVAALAPLSRAPSPRRRVGRFVLAALLLIALALAAVAIRVQTDKGEFIVDATNDVAVLVDKAGLKIRDKATGREYSLRPGKHPLRSGEYQIDVAELPSGLELSTDTFRLTRGGEATVTVRLKPNEKSPVNLDTLKPSERDALQAAEAVPASEATSAAVSKPENAQPTVSPVPSATATRVATPTGVNLLVDSSFEATPIGGLPGRWSRWFEQGPDSRGGVIEGGRTDKHCLEVLGRGTRAVVFANSIPVDRTKRYALKGWVKFDGDADACAIIKFNYFHNGTFLGVHDLSGVIGKQATWQLLEKTDAADTFPEASTLVPTCHIEGSGTAWFDDLEVVAYDRDNLPANFDNVLGKNNRPSANLDFDRWVGQWDNKIVLKSTRDVPSERTNTYVAQTRKVLSDRFLLTHSANEVNATEYISLLTYDQNLAAYRIWLFWNRGETYERQGQWNPADQTLTLNRQPPAPGVTDTSLDRFLGPDQIESSVLVQTNGQVTRNVQWTSRRTSTLPSGDIPSVSEPAAEPAELSFLNKFAGEWTIRATNKPSVWLPSGGQETQTERVVWILGGKFLMARTFNEQGQLTSIWLATYEPAEKSNRFWFFSSDGSTGQWRVTWDAASRGFHWRSIDMPPGWIGTGFNRWINDDTFDNQALIKDENGRVLLDGVQDKRRTKP